MTKTATQTAAEAMLKARQEAKAIGPEAATQRLKELMGDNDFMLKIAELEMLNHAFPAGQLQQVINGIVTGVGAVPMILAAAR